MSDHLLAQISRDFLTDHRVYRYRMKKLNDMDDESVIRYCHWYCEEQGLTREFQEFRRNAEVLEAQSEKSLLPPPPGEVARRMP